jgi:uncharacterized protein with PIN domain
MKTRTIRCDKCGKTETGMRDGLYKFDYRTYHVANVEFDLCPDCAKSFEEVERETAMKRAKVLSDWITGEQS